MGLLTPLGGCRSSEPREGQRVSCRCTYLTDYDDTATVDVDVCVPKGTPIDREAATCAGRSAHNHIDRCTCQPPSGPCNPGAADACGNR